MAITGSQPSYMYALGGYARGGATRGGDTDPQTYITIGGVHVGAAPAVAAQHVVDGTLEIIETEGATPNTASFQVMGFQPTDGQEVIITQGSKNNLDRLFAGTILTDAHNYVGTPASYNERIHVIDHTWLLTRDTLSQQWQTKSATVIAQDIIAIAAGRGVTSTYVAAGLPVLDEFSVTNQTPAQALDSLADRIGATWKSTYRSPVAGARSDVRFGITTDTLQTDPTTLTLASVLLTRMENFSVTRDLSQVITRQPVEGGGGNALTDIVPGETILPVTLADWYNPLGGTVVSGPQRIPYTGVQPGGAGSLVGPSAAPTVAAIAELALGSGVDSGPHSWAYSWVTAAGRTLPSPLGSATCGPVPVLVAAPGASFVSNAFFSTAAAGTTIDWALALFPVGSGSSGVGKVGPIGPSASVVTTGAHGYYALSFTVTAAMVGWYASILRRDNAGSWYGPSVGGPFVVTDVGRVITVNDIYTTAVQWGGNTGTTFTADPNANQMFLLIALGPTGTTGREIYRTPIGSSQLKLVATIANNTATSFIDTVADAALGANAPVTDTSGLSTVTGTVPSGSTSMLTPGAGGFPSSGWVIAGQQVIRYTGISGNTLTGIPASGPGSILSTLNYGDHLDPAPALTGIAASGPGSILYTIKAGDAVNLRVVVDDLSAQAVIAALMLPTVDDGVIEGAVIKDSRISEIEARARGTAQLALRSAIDVAVTYDTRDKNTHASRTVPVNLPSPTSVVGSFKLQSVTIDGFTPGLWPVAHAHGANKRFTLEDLLRIARGA